MRPLRTLQTLNQRVCTSRLKSLESPLRQGWGEGEMGTLTPLAASRSLACTHSVFLVCTGTLYTSRGRDGSKGEAVEQHQPLGDTVSPGHQPLGAPAAPFIGSHWAKFSLVLWDCARRRMWIFLSISKSYSKSSSDVFIGLLKLFELTNRSVKLSFVLIEEMLNKYVFIYGIDVVYVTNVRTTCSRI